MKYYENMNYGENLGWCKPYISEDERYALALNSGKIITVRVGGRDLLWDDEDPIYGSPQFSSGLLRRLAQTINPDYDEYDGHTDTHIILDAMQERGCAACPWRDECDAMIEEE